MLRLNQRPIQFVPRGLWVSFAMLGLACGGWIEMPVAAAGGGTIQGHVRLVGTLPGNPVIRMGRDPMCAAINRGKQVVQLMVAASADGSLANVFVELQGTFPDTPVPSTPVTIEQRECLYAPRVAGVRVGQALQIRNGDQLLHNVHSVSVSNPEFNVAQPLAGMTYRTTPRSAERMLLLKCDVHSWMTAYIAVVTHPYFAVTDSAGAFTIVDAPPGSYAVQAWHERYGLVSGRVRVVAGATATVDFRYPSP